ncbi:hypothetical protein BC567DRAFT_220730 [Phyllosticta citribraziliensis]
MMSWPRKLCHLCPWPANSSPPRSPARRFYPRTPRDLIRFHQGAPRQSKKSLAERLAQLYRLALVVQHDHLPTFGRTRAVLARSLTRHSERQSNNMASRQMLRQLLLLLPAPLQPWPLTAARARSEMGHVLPPAIFIEPAKTMEMVMGIKLHDLDR